MANLFQEDIRKSAEEIGCWHRRMRDSINKFGSASPFDELISLNGYSLGLECKMINDKAQTKSFAFNKVSGDQIVGLMELDRQWNHRGYVLINFRWIDHKKGRVFALPILDFLYLKQLSEEEKNKLGINSKSIPLDYFKDNILELPRLGKGWNLSLLI